jgi:hypothetical protein
MPVSIIDEQEMEPTPRLRLVPTPDELEELVDVSPAPARPDPLPEPRRPRLPFQFPTKEVVAVLSAIALIISVRLSLILGFMATASLFWIAATAPSIGSISAAGLFAVLVFWPLSWLALKKG